MLVYFNSAYEKSTLSSLHQYIEGNPLLKQYETGEMSCPELAVPLLLMQYHRVGNHLYPCPRINVCYHYTMEDVKSET